VRVCARVRAEVRQYKTMQQLFERKQSKIDSFEAEVIKSLPPTAPVSAYYPHPMQHPHSDPRFAYTTYPPPPPYHSTGMTGPTSYFPSTWLDAARGVPSAVRQQVPTRTSYPATVTTSLGNQDRRWAEYLAPSSRLGLEVRLDGSTDARALDYSA
jgi:hypothetical protein